MIYLIIILYCAIFVKQLMKSILFFWTNKKMTKQIKSHLFTVLSFFKWIFMTDKFKNL